MRFDESKVTYTVDAVQDWEPVRGNAMASGDAAYDGEIEDEILRRLDAGDVWAWALVKVTARYEGIDEVEGVDTLGCCTYDDEAQFIEPGGYYDDMKAAACDDLRAKLEGIAAVLCS